MNAPDSYAVPEREQPKPAEPRFIRLTKAQHYAFWRERFTDAEIRAMGASIESAFA